MFFESLAAKVWFRPPVGEYHKATIPIRYLREN